MTVIATKDRDRATQVKLEHQARQVQRRNARKLAKDVQKIRSTSTQTKTDNKT